jgi:LacI family transcriptional regulator
MDSSKRRVTRNDVAIEAGVSPATVSYVINNGPRPVAVETRQRVLEAIDRLGYHPNAVARSLRLQRTTILGLILPDTQNPYFAEVIRGVEKVTFERGFSLMLCHSDYTLEREIHYTHVLQTERTAGVLWFPATGDPQPAKMLQEYGIPFVILDRIVGDPDFPAVITNNFRGGYLATQHLIQVGHRRIGCIARPIDLYHSQERVRGFQAALSDYGIPFDERYVVRGGFQLADGRSAAYQLFDLYPPPTAIFAYNDFMAIGALRAARDRQLQIPQDISIVGFDDIPQSSYTFPALTTVRQPKFEMGYHGAELLLSIINGNETPAEARQPLEVELIIRDSTGPVNVSQNDDKS